MECPQCKGYQLEPQEIEPGLMAGVCPKCTGALLSLMNYRFWVEQQSPVEINETEDVVVEDNGKAKACPKCSRLMSKYQVGEGTNTRVDLCSGCEEAWLDKGEWQLLKKMDMHNKLPKIFTDAWQRNIRIQRQEKFLKKQYMNLLGENDFRKADMFKQWLDEHPEKSKIQQYLITKVDL